MPKDQGVQTRQEFGATKCHRGGAQQGLGGALREIWVPLKQPAENSGKVNPGNR